MQKLYYEKETRSIDIKLPDSIENPIYAEYVFNEAADIMSEKYLTNISKSDNMLLDWDIGGFLITATYIRLYFDFDTSYKHMQRVIEPLIDILYNEYLVK